MISLSDLKAKRAAMRADQHHDRYTNAVTLVLEASDELIEIAEAALELGPELVYLRGPLSERLRTALTKVTP